MALRSCRGLAVMAMLWLAIVGMPVAAAPPNYQGLWWNAQESGWGINFSHQGDIIFATWFTYDAQGKPLWLIAALQKTADGVYSGPVSTVTGPAFNAVPFAPAPVETEVGTMTVTFADAGHATLAYTVHGIAQSKQITPQIFGAAPTCVWGAQPDLALATNYQDLWWNPQESGWGVNFTHQGDLIFATWFTYDAQGKPWWLIATLQKGIGKVYSGTVSTVTGPAFNAQPWNASPIVETEVGTATATFADGNTATFAYTVNGASRSKPITRQVFTAPGTVCSPPLTPAEKRKDAARFLRQATFGAPREAIDALVVQGYDAWLNEQFAKPLVSHVATVKADPAMVELMTGSLSAMHSLLKQYFEGEDQLRQRVSNALSQIFVISFRNDVVGGSPCSVPGYVDILNREAFGNVRDLLKSVTLSPAMGEYLSMKGSAKADPILQTQPDENYAREVMQLFSVGTVMLNIDGSVQLDTEGKAQPSYNENTVQGFAKALSGWTFGGQNQTQPDRWIRPDSGGSFSAATLDRTCEAWSAPMEPWLAAYRSADDTRTIPGPVHDTGAKQLLVYPGAPFSTLPPGQSPQTDLENVIDNLFHHPNVGPFLATRLIQRLVTSNPSPQYVERVARAFNDNGSGVRGDMKAVVRAILLDDQARNLAVAAQPSFGKLGEPLVRYIQYNRAFHAREVDGYYQQALGQPTELNQDVLRAPSVFNFYSPTFMPAGPLSVSNLVGPEFEITDTASVAGYADFSGRFFIPGNWDPPGNPKTGLLLDHSYYLGLVDTPATLVDELDIVVCAGGLGPAARTQIVQALANSTPEPWHAPGVDIYERLRMVLWLLLNSPDCSVQK